MASEPVHILVTGAGGEVGNHLIPMIARGAMLGPDQPVILHLLDIPAASEDLNNVVKGVMNLAPRLVHGVVTGDIPEVCRGVQIAVMIGSFMRNRNVERNDEMNNFSKSVILALEAYAAANSKIVIAANPGNTTALIFRNHARSIPERNITCLMRHDHNRALGQISERLGVRFSDVKNVIIWGNQSSTQYPDINHAVVNTLHGERLVRGANVGAWVNEDDFITCVQSTSVVITRERTRASARSAASVSSAICDHIHDWIFGTKQGTWVSMGVFSDGSYNVPSGLIHSFPVICRNGEWAIVPGLQTDNFSQRKMNRAREASIRCHHRSFDIASSVGF